MCIYVDNFWVLPLALFTYKQAVYEVIVDFLLNGTVIQRKEREKYCDVFFTRSTMLMYTEINEFCAYLENRRIRKMALMWNLTAIFLKSLATVCLEGGSGETILEDLTEGLTDAGIDKMKEWIGQYQFSVKRVLSDSHLNELHVENPLLVRNEVIAFLSNVELDFARLSPNDYSADRLAEDLWQQYRGMHPMECDEGVRCQIQNLLPMC